MIYLIAATPSWSQNPLNFILITLGIVTMGLLSGLISTYLNKKSSFVETLEKNLQTGIFTALFATIPAMVIFSLSLLINGGEFLPDQFIFCLYLLLVLIFSLPITFLLISEGKDND